MSQKVLHINSRLTVSAEEFEQDNGAQSAQALVDVPGLLWKIAYTSHDQKEAGGFYLFNDEATLRAYFEGPIVAELAGYPLWTDMTVSELDILVDFSKVLRAPIGEKYELGNAAPKTFGGMANEAFHTVPSIKAADLQRRQKKEPDLLVIDVRDAAEVAQTGTVPGAINLSLGSLIYLADNEVPESWRHPQLADRARPIITTCILGPMGAIGGKLLHDMGFSNVQILEGGVQAWIEAGLPVTGNEGETHV
jgi:rhodanese-related sulfurtransferase